MSLHNKSDRGRDVFVDNMGGGNMYVAVRGGGLRGIPPAPPYRGRDDGGSWRGSRGRSRLPEGHWRGGRGGSGSRGGSSNSGGGERSNYHYYKSGPNNRRPPAPRYDDLLQTDSKQDRQQSRQEMWRGNRGGNSLRRGSKFRLDRRPAVNPGQFNSGWQKFTIHDCAQHEPAKVMEEVTSMLGENFDYHLLATEGNNITFYLEDSPAMGKSLMELSKRLAMPGSGQRHTISVMTTNNPPFQPPTADNLEKVKLVMADRYSQHLKRLDLSEFHKDKNFRSIELLFPLYVPSNLASVGRLIVANVLDVAEIDLSRNKLMRLEAIADHVKACPALTRLGLNNNKILTVTSLHKLKGLPITELNLEGNPLCARYKDFEAYISDIRSCFPKLLVLDGKELPRPIGFEVDDVEVVMPPVLASFSCDEGARVIVRSFLDLYYKVFDSGDRSGLGAAYCEDAIFSLTSLLPENGPKAVTIDNERMPNRNLKVLSATEDRVELLFRGREAIMKEIVNKLPPSTHDVNNLVVDIPLAKPQLVKVVVSGVYRREGLRQQNASIRAFQRSLIIVPQGSGFCIANEQLYVTLATHEQIKEAFKSDGAGPSAAGRVAAVAVAPPATGGLEPQQLLMIEQFSADSKMKPEYSKMCLEQNAWDFQKAANLFVSLKAEGKIPPEYFLT